MKTIHDIPDSSILVIHGHELKSMISDLTESITAKIETMGNPARMVKTTEAKDVTGLSRSSLMRLVDAGELHPVKSGRDLKWSLSELLEYNKKNAQ